MKKLLIIILLSIASIANGAYIDSFTLLNSTFKTLGTQVTSGDSGLVVNSVIHALSTAGGGTYVDVKANPSGALTVDSTVTSSVLPTGASTEATISAINSKFNSLGQKLMSGSVPVTLASDQSTLPVSLASVPVHGVTQSGAWSVGVNNFPATQAISATSLPLPSGASTSALQTTGNSSLSSIDSKLPNQGQALMAGSVPVAIASNQSTLNVNTGLVQGLTDAQLRATPVPISGTVTANTGLSQPLTDSQLRASAVPVSVSGVSTSANQTTMITSLQSIDTKTTIPTAKGVQGSSATPVQNLLDAGRTNRVFSASFTSATTEAMLSLTPITEGVAGVANTEFTATAGKILRLQGMCVSTRNAGASAQGVVIQLRRLNTTGITVTSPLVGTVATGTGIAVANVSASNCIGFNDGIEITNGQYFGVSRVGSATANNSFVIYGFEY